jgi:hypothetical protein
VSDQDLQNAAILQMQNLLIASNLANLGFLADIWLSCLLAGRVRNVGMMSSNLLTIMRALA